VTYSFKKIHLIEPIAENIRIAKRELGSFKNIEFLTCGVSNKKTTLHFNEEKSFSTIYGKGTNSVEVDTIDNLVSEKVDYIKLDIEGAEQDALDGAKKTIQKYKPILAICVYHKAEDWYKIPEKILEILEEGFVCIDFKIFEENNEPIVYFKDSVYSLDKYMRCIHEAFKTKGGPLFIILDIPVNTITQYHIRKAITNNIPREDVYVNTYNLHPTYVYVSTIKPKIIFMCDFRQKLISKLNMIMNPIICDLDDENVSMHSGVINAGERIDFEQLNHTNFVQGMNHIQDVHKMRGTYREIGLYTG